MKKPTLTFVMLLVMHVCLFIVSTIAFDRGSDAQIGSVIVLWCAGSIYGIVRLHKSAAPQKKQILIYKLWIVLSYLFALVPMALAGFFLFLIVALTGVDFK